MPSSVTVTPGRMLPLTSLVTPVTGVESLDAGISDGSGVGREPLAGAATKVNRMDAMTIAASSPANLSNILFTEALLLLLKSCFTEFGIASYIGLPFLQGRANRRKLAAEALG
jgi:hypothetical protein